MGDFLGAAAVILISFFLGALIYFAFRVLCSVVANELRRGNNQYVHRSLHGYVEAKGFVISSALAKKYRLVEAKLGKRPTYQLNVKYRYKVDGLEYVGEKTSFSDQYTLFKMQAESLMGKYGVGSAVRVFYRPEKPSDAVAFVDDGMTYI